MNPPAKASIAPGQVSSLRPAFRDLRKSVPSLPGPTPTNDLPLLDLDQHLSRGSVHTIADYHPRLRTNMLPTINQHVNPSVCLILPAYNKALEISPCIKGLVEQALSSSIDLHLVVVDDASSDGTSEQARKDYGAPVTVIRLDANSGKGGAIRAGSRFASTSVDYIGFFDADLDINPRALPDLVHAIESSHGAAGALASKAHPLSTVHRSLLRRAGSYVFSIITRISLGVPRMDTQTGAKLFRRDEFEKLMLVSTINGFAFDVELLAQASRARMRLVEAPVHLKPHTYSTLSIRNVARAFTDLWLVRSALKKGS